MGDILWAITALLVLVGVGYMLVPDLRFPADNRVRRITQVRRWSGSASTIESWVFAQLSKIIRGRPSVSVQQTSQHHFVLLDRSRPAWRIIPVVLLFPVGLIFLIRPKRTVNIAISHEDGVCTVRFTGSASGEITRLLREKFFQEGIAPSLR